MPENRNHGLPVLTMSLVSQFSEPFTGLCCRGAFSFLHASSSVIADLQAHGLLSVVVGGVVVVCLGVGFGVVTAEPVVSVSEWFFSVWRHSISASIISL